LGLLSIDKVVYGSHLCYSEREVGISTQIVINLSRRSWGCGVVSRVLFVQVCSFFGGGGRKVGFLLQMGVEVGFFRIVFVGGLFLFVKCFCYSSTVGFAKDWVLLKWGDYSKIVWVCIITVGFLL
jgi:hypothetical protein